MMENFQFAAITLMTLMTVALAIWMPRHLNDDKVLNRSRWMMAAGLALLGIHFVIQYVFKLRVQGVTPAVFVNLLFFIPCSYFLSLCVLNLQRQARLRPLEWLAGPLTLLIAAGIMIDAYMTNGLQPLADTPQMRRAEVTAGICYSIMQIYYTYLQITEMRRMRRALDNYYDRERGNLLNWMLYTSAVLATIAIMLPVLIYFTGPILVVYGLIIFGGLFYMWLQFIGYIRTNAANSMREAQENEEELDLEPIEPFDRLKDRERIEEATRNWLSSDRHLRCGITIKTAADEMQIPRHQLTAWLKTTEYGQFSNWITYYRIEAAKDMLKQHNDWNNETIAQECGFNTRNYFQAVFRKQTGMTPAQYVESL